MFDVMHMTYFSGSTRGMGGVVSLAAVGLALTGSIDKMSPWQPCVEFEHKPGNIWCVNWTQQFCVLAKSKTMGAKRKMKGLRKRVRKRNSSVCVGVSVCVLGMIQAWKEEDACRYCFSFHSYLLLCRNFFVYILVFLFLIRHSLWHPISL